MSLMDAIKQMNGIKSLRHRPTDEEAAAGGGDGAAAAEPQKPKKDEPGDMFDELKKRLGMRRNVMKNDDANDADDWGDD